MASRWRWPGRLSWPLAVIAMVAMLALVTLTILGSTLAARAVVGLLSLGLAGIGVAGMVFTLREARLPQTRPRVNAVVRKCSMDAVDGYLLEVTYMPVDSPAACGRASLHTDKHRKIGASIRVRLDPEHPDRAYDDVTTWSTTWWLLFCLALIGFGIFGIAESVTSDKPSWLE